MLAVQARDSVNRPPGSDYRHTDGGSGTATPLIFPGLLLLVPQSAALEESLTGMRSLPVPKVLRASWGHMLVAVRVMATASHFTQNAEHLVQSAWLQFGFVGLFALTVPHLVLEEIRKARTADALVASNSVSSGSA